jgi:hypothetical protein
MEFEDWYHVPWLGMTHSKSDKKIIWTFSDEIKMQRCNVISKTLEEDTWGCEKIWG